MKLLTLFVLTAGVASAQLTNVSTRLHVDEGDSVTISFTIPDGASQTVYLRAGGPILSKYGVTGVLADPKIELYKGSNLIAQNDDWTPASVGAGAPNVFNFDPGSKDAALSINLGPGSYSMKAFGSDGGQGIALPELYSVDNGAPGFSRVSVEGTTGPQSLQMIAGLISKNDRYLIRALRPTPEVSNSLADPSLTLFSGISQAGQNDNWQNSSDADVIAKAVSAYGLTPFNADGKDAALLYQFPSGLGGSITVQVGGHEGTGKVRLEFIDLSIAPPVNAVPVPEPASYAVAACGLLALEVIRRRKKKV